LAKEHLVDESPLAARLLRAEAAKWSGTLGVTVAGRHVGSVMMIEGGLVWATSKDQRETLGAFLWRLGRITRSQLEIAQNLYSAHQRQKKLGQILAELDYMDPLVFRRCLLLHTRAALRALARCEGAEVRESSAPLIDEDEVRFSVEEVLGPLEPAASLEEDDEGESAEWARWSERNAVLRPLSTCEGYLLSGVFSADGQVLAAHGGSALPLLRTLLASVLESASRTVGVAGLGELAFTIIEGSQGQVVALWLDEYCKNLMVVMASSAAPPDALRRAVLASLPRLKSWAAERSLASYFKSLVLRAESEGEQTKVLKVAMRVRLRELRRAGGNDEVVGRLERAIDLLQSGRLREVVQSLSEVSAAGQDAVPVDRQPT
jgi:predicted regulator of Ras-like GTPase activity (Roadblock/LC7/MglB family)